jgi:hypothetical protein
MYRNAPSAMVVGQTRHVKPKLRMMSAHAHSAIRFRQAYPARASLIIGASSRRVQELINRLSWFWRRGHQLRSGSARRIECGGRSSGRDRERVRTRRERGSRQRRYAPGRRTVHPVADARRYALCTGPERRLLDRLRGSDDLRSRSFGIERGRSGLRSRPVTTPNSCLDVPVNPVLIVSPRAPDLILRSVKDLTLTPLHTCR